MRRWAAVLLMSLSAVFGVSLAFLAIFMANRTSAVAPSVTATPYVQPAARLRPSHEGFPAISAVHPDPERAASLLAPIFRGDFLSHAGVAVVAQDGTSLFERHADQAMAPASTMKLLAASTVLNMLGPQYRFTTEITTEAAPKKGTINGSIWLTGNGDPLFTSDDLREGAAALARLGVRRVTGNLLVDDSAFRGPERNPNWDTDDLQYGYAAGNSAVSLDQGTVEFDVTPTLPGNPAEVRTQPANLDVRVQGQIVTALRGEGTLLHIDLKPSTGKGADNIFAVDGHIEEGTGTQRFWQPVQHLARYAGFALLSMLKDRGVTVDGDVHVDQAPLIAQTLWSHRSQPLEAILRDMLVTSNNHSAEQMLRVVGAQERHVGTVETGALAERQELQRMAIPVPGLRIIDGSGLSPANRVAPITLARLVAAELQSPEGERFLLDLPRVGIEGTVSYHHVRDALGKARAKSGHIEGVNALAGTVQTTHHGRVAFAILVNDPRAYAGEVTEAQDRMLDVLARL